VPFLWKARVPYSHIQDISSLKRATLLDVALDKWAIDSASLQPSFVDRRAIIRFRGPDDNAPLRAGACRVESSTSLVAAPSA
jgi:hypothetical protein